MQTHTGCCPSTMGVLSSQLPYPASIGYLSRFIPCRYLHDTHPHTHTHYHTHNTKHYFLYPPLALLHLTCSLKHTLTRAEKHTLVRTHTHAHTQTHADTHRHTQTHTDTRRRGFKQTHKPMEGMLNCLKSLFIQLLKIVFNL